MTTHQKLEYSRELRLWLSEFLLPMGLAVFAALRSDEVKQFIRNESQKIKSNVVNHR